LFNSVARLQFTLENGDKQFLGDPDSRGLIFVIMAADIALMGIESQAAFPGSAVLTGVAPRSRLGPRNGRGPEKAEEGEEGQSRRTQVNRRLMKRVLAWDGWRCRR
jgi:hypothetical protein